MTNPRDVKYANESIAQWQDALKQRTLVATDNMAFAILRAWLHEVRSRLTISETAKFGNALPAVQRGVYYQGWDPEAPLVPTLDLSEFNQALAKRLLPHVHMPHGLAEDMMWVLKSKLEKADQMAVEQVLPKPLLELWMRTS